MPWWGWMLFGLGLLGLEAMTPGGFYFLSTRSQQQAARIIGPNCLGVLSPDGAKMGGLGGPAVNVRRAFKKGPIGVMSRSGGMTTEIANTLTAAS